MHPTEKVYVARLPAISVLKIENVGKTTSGVSALPLYQIFPTSYTVVAATVYRNLSAESNDTQFILRTSMGAELEPVEAEKRDFRHFGKEYLKNYRK